MGLTSSKEKKQKRIMKEIIEKDIEKMKESENLLDYERENFQLTVEDNKKITFQTVSGLCKIFNNDKGCGSGFFCSLKYSEKEPPIKTLITNNHVLDIQDIALDKEIKISINNYASSRRIKIGEKRKLYTNAKYDITIIEIKDTDDLNFVKYLEVDKKVFDEIDNDHRRIDRVYLIHYPGKSTISSISYGDMTIGDNNISIKHTCLTEHGSSGSPILDLSTFKVLAIHKGAKSNSKVGTFLKKPIEEFESFKKEGILDNYGRLKEKVIHINEEEKEKVNKITIILKAKKNDIKGKIYFLGNSEDDKKNNKELNKNNVEIIIDQKKVGFQKYIEIKDEKDVKEYSITLIFKHEMEDCSYMFFNCTNITKIDLSFFNSKKVNKMHHMFSRCYNLNEIDLRDFNTLNVTDMSFLFSKCKSLPHVDLSSFDTDKVTTMCGMFQDNSSITQIYVPFFNTENVKDMSCMFCRCYKLQKINLQSFNTENVINMSQMFDECIELKEIETTSQFFSTENSENMSHMFRRCNNLKMKLNFNIKKAKYLSYMFSGCEKLTNINLSNFQTTKVKDMTYMFSGCKNITNIDISNFTIDEKAEVKNMFNDCTILKKIKVNKKYKQKIQSQNDNYKNKIK